MAIANIIGGLGNQMFQYAAARAVSLDRGTPLLLDISNFSNYRRHQGFELQRIFCCPVEMANKSDLRDILGWQHSRSIRRLLTHPSMAILRSQNFIVEPHSHYWGEIRNIPKDCYLIGYWQSEKYFQNYASVIRSDFTFKNQTSNQNSEVATIIKNRNAVGLHIRRGDYAKDPKTYSTHGLCSLNYYRAAIQYIAEKVEFPYFFIFSDDIEWANANLCASFPCQYVDHNQGMDSYNDMRLMSLCKHNIIANSTFSWWAAWLNTNPDKIVIAPKIWFANPNIVSDYKMFMDDLIPSDWVRL